MTSIGRLRLDRRSYSAPRPPRSEAADPRAHQTAPHPGAFDFAPSGHRISWRRRIAGQRDELVVIEVGQLHTAGAPVGLGLFDAVLRRRDEVPLDEALADRLTA